MGFLKSLGKITKAVYDPVGTVKSALEPRKDTVTQEEMLSEEQKQARKLLLDFAKTGEYGGVRAGEAYQGSLGNFDLAPQESQALGKLSQMLQGGQPEVLNNAIATINSLLTGDRFDPYSSTGEFAGFKSDVEREVGQSAARLKRNAAFGKNLYSSSTVKNLTNLESEAQNALNSKLAQLYTDYTNRKLAAVPVAGQLATTQRALEFAPIEASLNYGGIQRNLDTAKSQAKLSEYLRQRQEALMPLGSAQAVLGTPTQWGAKSVDVYTPSPWMDLLKTGVQAGAQYLGARG